jgi:Tol biopolymer transport system component
MLASGVRIGTFEIVAPLGAGGMGEVYRARDTRLGREVAVKVLPPELASDSERLARVEREARVLAALNHPNIAAIYGLEHDGNAPALVLELVDGETLAARVDRGALPVKEAVDVARQIMLALDAAHETGIVHRDLKPGNVALTRSGTVKVLDFGLAKAGVSAELGASDVQTLTHDATREGVVVGTAAYMSPEQARGRAVDKRTDVWAFGCVLYEMLTGRLAFPGASLPDTLAAVLERQPDFTLLPAATPVSLRRLVERCLEKDPARRLRDIGDARPDLDEALAPPTASEPNRPAGRVWLARMVPLGLAALAATLLAVLARPSGRTLDTAAFRFVPLAAEPGDETSPAWSPDGRSIAYTAEAGGVRQLFTRSLDAAVATQVTTAATDCRDPFWSGDATRIFFSDGNEYVGDLWSVGATGGEPQLVLKDASVAALTPDGRTLAFVRGLGGKRGLWITGTTKLEPQRYRTSPFPETFNRSGSVDFSRDGSKLAVLLARQKGASFVTELWVVPYPSGTPRVAFADASDLFGGHISWMPDGRHLVLSGELSGRPGIHLYIVDAERSSPVLPITSGTVNEEAPSVSPSGSQIAFAAGGNDVDIVRVPLDGSRVEPLLASARTETWPAWSPTGSQLAYVTNARGPSEIWLRSVDEGWARPVIAHDPDAASTSFGRPVFSPDGQRLAHEVYAGATHTVWVSSVTDGRGVPLDGESRDQHGPAWSPDGRWIAYTRLAAGAWEVVKVPSGGGRPTHLAEAHAGGGSTAWSPGGEWIAYAYDGLVLTSVDGSRQKRLSSWQPAAFGFSPDGSLYAVRHASDGSWTLMALDIANGRERELAVLDLPPRATLAGFSLHPKGKAFATGMGLAHHDIWLLQGFALPSRWRDLAGL